MNYANIIYKMGVIYLLFPYYIFFSSWMKPSMKVISLCIIICCSVKILRDDELCANNILYIDKTIIFVCAIIVFVWIAFSGIGGFAFQNEDFLWRNAMFDALVTEKWPMTLLIEKNGEMINRGYSYYMGFWLPAAAMAKMFGMRVGNIVQFVWAFLGIVIFVSLVWNKLAEVKIWPILLFIFFSGLDYLGMIVYGTSPNQINMTMHLEWWASVFQYSSFTTQLYWVFNQAIPAWVATMLIVEAKNNKYIVFILGCTMLNCTMPFVGLIPVMFTVIIRNFMRKKEGYVTTKSWIIEQGKEILTLTNILGGGCVGIISYLFLSKETVVGGGTMIDLSHGGWSIFLMFLLIEIFVYVAFTYEKEKRNPLYYVVVASLCVFPLIKLNDDGNFCMRGSIPMLVILYIFTCETIIYLLKKENKKKLMIYVCFFILGAITPIHEIERSILQTKNEYLYPDMQDTHDIIGIQEIMQNDFESTDVDNNLFYKYIAEE